MQSSGHRSASVVPAGRLSLGYSDETTVPHDISCSRTEHATPNIESAPPSLPPDSPPGPPCGSDDPSSPEYSPAPPVEHGVPPAHSVPSAKHVAGQIIHRGVPLGTAIPDEPYRSSECQDMSTWQAKTPSQEASTSWIAAAQSTPAAKRYPSASSLQLSSAAVAAHASYSDWHAL